MLRINPEKLPLQCKWNLSWFGILHSVDWQFPTDVSGQHIVPIFKGQASWLLKMGLINYPETLVRNYHSMLCTIPKEDRYYEDIIYKRWEP